MERIDRLTDGANLLWVDEEMVVFFGGVVLAGSLA
jgi:hypothetical protein